MGQHVALILIARDLFRVFDTVQHEVRRATPFRVDMYSETFLVSLDDQRHHLVVVVETLHTVIAGLVQIVLVLPSRMRFGHAVQESLDTNDLKIFTTILGAICSDSGNFSLRVCYIISSQRIGVCAQLQFAFLFQIMVSLGRFGVENLRTSISDSCITVL